MTLPTRIFMGTHIRRAIPGETIEVWLSSEEGRLPFRTTSGTLIVVEPESPNIASMIARWAPSLCPALEHGPWTLLLEKPPSTTGLFPTKQNFTFPSQNQPTIEAPGE